MGTTLSQVFPSIESLSIEDGFQFPLEWKFSREIRSIFQHLSNGILDRTSVVYSLSWGILGWRFFDLSLFVTIFVQWFSLSRVPFEYGDEIDVSSWFVVLLWFCSWLHLWTLDVRWWLPVSSTIYEHWTTLSKTSIRFSISLSFPDVLQLTFTYHQQASTRFWIAITTDPWLCTSSGRNWLLFLDNDGNATLFFGGLIIYFSIKSRWVWSSC